MAQAGFTPIQLYHSATPAAVPTAGNLIAGELAINTADGKLFFEDSSGVVQVLATTAGASGTVTSVGGTGTVNGITLTGTVTSSGSLTLGGTLSGVNLTSQVTGTLPIANGGTGSTSTTYVNLATNVTGTLPIANGGTGITSFGSGVATWLGTPSSANLAAAVTDKTGSGALVFATSPTLVTPTLGTPASVTLTNATGLPTAGLVDNAVTDEKLRDSGALSVIGRSANSTGNPADISAGANHQVLRRDGSSLGFGAVDLSSNQAVTGTLPVANGGTGITSFGSGVATWLGTPSSANLAAALTDETGSGAAVFATSPTLVTPVLGTPTSGTLSGCTVDGTNALGFREIPQNSQSAAYTLVLTDSGKHILHPSADTTARTFTIPANGAVAFPIGTAVTFINQNAAGVITIAITTDTMRLAGAGTTGSRTLAANGVATAIKLTSTEWIISGTGLT